MDRRTFLSLGSAALAAAVVSPAAAPTAAPVPPLVGAIDVFEGFSLLQEEVETHIDFMRGDELLRRVAQEIVVDDEGNRWTPMFSGADVPAGTNRIVFNICQPNGVSVGAVTAECPNLALHHDDTLTIILAPLRLD